MAGLVGGMPGAARRALACSVIVSLLAACAGGADDEAADTSTTPTCGQAAAEGTYTYDVTGGVRLVRAGPTTSEERVTYAEMSGSRQRVVTETDKGTTVQLLALDQRGIRILRLEVVVGADRTVYEADGDALICPRELKQGKRWSTRLASSHGDESIASWRIAGEEELSVEGRAVRTVVIESERTSTVAEGVTVAGSWKRWFAWEWGLVIREEVELEQTKPPSRSTRLTEVRELRSLEPAA